MIELLEQQKKLTTNQWKLICTANLADLLDFFDFFLIGYGTAALAKQWALTYWEGGGILLASGLGAVPGAFFWGWLGARIGRRTVFIMSAITISLATGLMVFTPGQAGFVPVWLFLMFFRFFVGVGNAGIFTIDLPLVQEFIPAYKRGWVSALITTLLPGSATGARLGADDRSQRDRLAEYGARGQKNALGRAVQISAVGRRRVSHRPDPDRRRLAWAVGTDPAGARPGAQDHPGTRGIPDDIRQPGGDPRAVQHHRADRALGAALFRDALLRAGSSADGARRLSARCLYRRRVAVLHPDRGAKLFRQRRLHRRRAVYGGDLAGPAACQRHGPQLWRRQLRQVHRPARAGTDHGRGRADS